MSKMFGFILFLSSFSVWAEEAIPASAPAMSGQLIMLAGFLGIFYFLVWRPQSKRAKTHQQLLQNLTAGDEIVTTGGLFGKITTLEDQFVSIEVAKGIEVKVQKHAVAQTMPKGTLKSL